MELLPNEERLISSNNDKVVLTTHRIQMSDSDAGNSYSIVIFLEDISSIETKYKSSITFMIIGCLAIIGGLFASSRTENTDAIVMGAIVGIIFFILWWFSRKHVISISPNGGKSLTFRAKRMKKGQVQHFLDKLQLAKWKRVNELYKS
jgi:hypothetical protein